MKILVTGVDGYIGTVLADYLTKTRAHCHRSRYRILSGRMALQR